MEKISYDGIKILELYLEKLELLSEEERRVFVKTIDILNHPILIT